MPTTFVDDPEIYAASDYAGIKVGKYSFYYGYEQTKTVDGEDQWAFVAKVNDNEAMRLSTTELEMKHFSGMGDEPSEYLLVGLALFMRTL